jgi:hypothetical protein
LSGSHCGSRASRVRFLGVPTSDSLPATDPPAAFLESARGIGLNKSLDARDQSLTAVNHHRSERAHPRLPWHSQCPLAGIGRGRECCAGRDAPRFAAKPQVQGRLALGEEFGPLCEYAPTAARFKPCCTQTHLTSKIWDGWAVIQHPSLDRQ